MPMPTRPDSQMYERIAAAFVLGNESIGADINCKMNAFIEGAISNVQRQVDLLIEARLPSGRRTRILVDAKRYGRPLDVGEVESLEAMMRDCRADRGILVCPHGWTPAAQRRAQEAITIAILPEEDVLNSTYWSELDECYGPCYGLIDPNRRGVVLWDQERLYKSQGLYAVVWEGKCDRCHNFQVWCWDCGSKYSLGPESIIECTCERRWSTWVESDAVVLAVDFPEGRIMLDQRSFR